MSLPYAVLDRMRRGEGLRPGEIEAIVRGATDGSWDDAQLAAFLMAVAIRGLERRETAELARAMLESGDQWSLDEEIPGVGDKHSTGGVGDKISLVLAPLLAASGVPVAMLTGRGLGHTGGTADKLEAIPGVKLEVDRKAALESLRETGMAIGVATAQVAPADRRLYALRDVTGTVVSIPLVVASILSKKLALGAAAVIYDVKSGPGAFFEDLEEAATLAQRLVEVSAELGQPARALVTDMSQPLGRWAGHTAEVAEALDCLAGGGPADLAALTVELASELSGLVGAAKSARELRATLDSGRGREVFLEWAAHRGADSSWLRSPTLDTAPHELVVESPASGWLGAVDCRGLGLLLAEAGGGRRRPGDSIDHGVSLQTVCRLGERVERGQPLARFYTRQPMAEMKDRLLACFEIAAGAVEAPPLIARRIDSPAEPGTGRS